MITRVWNDKEKNDDEKQSHKALMDKRVQTRT
jgi:hypothetical protein